MYSPTADTRVETKQMDHLQYLVDSQPSVALMDHACELSDAQFRQCAEKWPDAAFMVSPSRLARDPELFRICIQIEPGFALDYAVDFLDDHQFVECVKKAPLTALACVYSRLCQFPDLLRDCIQKKPAGTLGDFGAIIPADDWSIYVCFLRRRRWESGSEVVLNDEEFHYCITHAPGPALKLEPFNKRLDDDQFAYCVEEAPNDALRSCWSRLNMEQKTYCIEKDTRTALRSCWSDLNDEQRTYCLEKEPSFALYTCWSRLSDEQKTYCVVREPSIALWHLGAELPTEILLIAANTKPFTVIEILNYKHGHEDFPLFRDNLIRALVPLHARLDPRVIAEAAKMSAQGL